LVLSVSRENGQRGEASSAIVRPERSKGSILAGEMDSLRGRVGVHLRSRKNCQFLFRREKRRVADLALATGQCDVDEAAGVCEPLLRATLTVRVVSIRWVVVVLFRLHERGGARVSGRRVANRRGGGKRTESSSSPACRPWGSAT
jgi:hypothetical protein